MTCLCLSSVSAGRCVHTSHELNGPVFLLLKRKPMMLQGCRKRLNLSYMAEFLKFVKDVSRDEPLSVLFGVYRIGIYQCLKGPKTFFSQRLEITVLPVYQWLLPQPQPLASFSCKSTNDEAGSRGLPRENSPSKGGQHQDVTLSS